MAVNPNLAALMRVIEDNQDKMPEGEYLEAMNALGALHREIPAPPVAMAAAPVAQGRRPDRVCGRTRRMGAVWLSRWLPPARPLPQGRPDRAS